MLALAIVACSGSGAADDRAATGAAPTDAGPVIPSAAGPPGTDLGDGFTVADGTTLIGDPIPIGVAFVRSGVPVVDEGWTATAVVDGGDPATIVAAYMAQAAAVGLTEQPGTGCALDVDVTICAAFARSADPGQPRSVTAAAVRGVRDDVVSDHVIIRFSTTDSSWESGDVALVAGRSDEVPGPPALGPLASVGDSLGTARETMRAFVVEEGSRLAGPPHLTLEDVTGGTEAIFEVTGDPRTVLQAYLDRMAEPGADPPEAETREIDGATVTTAGVSEAGGDQFDFTLVERSGRPTWLAVCGTHD